MAVETAASAVMQKLTDVLTESMSNEKLIGGRLSEIKKALEDMKECFLDAEDKHRNDENEKKWAEDCLTYLYEVEDKIESFAMCIALQRMRLGFLKNALFLKNCVASRMLGRNVKKIQVIIQKLNSGRPEGVKDANYGFAVSPAQAGIDSHVQNQSPIALPSTVENHHEEKEEGEQDMAFLRSVSDASIYRDRYKQAKLMYSYSYYEEELDIVGFRKEMDTLVTRLTDESNDAHGVECFVSIFGKKGSGKTTLVRAVCGNRKIRNSFKCFAWVNVPKEYDANNLWRNLLKQVGDREDQDLPITEPLLKSRLSERLRNNKYLIVLDDVRKYDTWEALRGALPNNKNGGKILLIISEEEIAVSANSNPFRIEQLSNKDSWDLFSKKVGYDLPWEGVDSKNVPPRILQACNGLPLNIVLLGSFLSAHKGAVDLDGRKHGSWTTDQLLSLCYNDLPYPLKLCLLYMLLFPRELDIPVRRLLRLWQAEGFVKPSDEQPTETKTFPEDVAQEYFDNLVKRSLIQVSKLRSDGRPRKCRLLGVLHDYLSPKALGIRLFHVHPENSNACEVKSVRRLVEYRDVNNCSFCHSQHRELKRLRSFLSFNDQKKDTPAKEVGNLLSKIVSSGRSLLRVLDLEGLYKPSLPENLGDFFHLRYLGLRWTFLDTLPQSVGDLYYLESLDVKHTYIKTLPPSIWKLKHLRHLNLNDIQQYMPRNMPSSLPKLLTLWGLSVDQESLVEDGQNNLVCLRELGITFHLENSGRLLDWISRLTALQQLTLRSKDDTGNPSNIHFKPLSELNQLSHLYLLGNLKNPPQVQDFPQGIKVLTLSVSRLLDDPMPMLGQLPRLTVLRLLANSYLGVKISCKEGGFGELQVLKLWKLEKLEKWELEEGAMERLKELNLRCCNNLKHIPSRLLHQKRFKELTLTNMPKEVEEQVNRENTHHIYTTVN